MAILDTIMITLFVLFMIYIFRGYHLKRLSEVNQDDETHEKNTTKE